MEEIDHRPHFNYVRLSHLVSTEGGGLLRKMFKTRYAATTNKEWANGSPSESSREFFLKWESKLNLTKEQKGMVSSGDIYKWDMTLLLKLLLNIKYRTVRARDPFVDESSGNFESDELQQEIENNALTVLKTVRNYVEHCVAPEIPEDEFNKRWNDAKEALVQCGLDEKEIDRVRTTGKLQGIEFRSSDVDQENMVKARSLRNQGGELVAAGKIEEGISLYSQALLLFGLSPEEKEAVYTCRCEAFLTLLGARNHPEDTHRDYLDSAINDAKATIESCPKSWKGYFLAGKVYQVQNLWDEAIDYFEQGLSFSPEDSAKILSALYECRYDRKDKEIQLQLDPKWGPVGYVESMKRLARERLNDPNYDPQNARDKVQNMKELVEAPEPVRHVDSRTLANACVFMGHLYRFGDEVPLDLHKSVELYRRAADLGSLSGKGCLGFMYLRGLGVERSVPEGVRITEELANTSLPKNLSQSLHDQEIQHLDRETIATAKFMMGKFHQDGVCRAQDEHTAAKWYQLASEDGSCMASTNLSLMYSTRVGEQAMASQRAIQYQRLAVEQGTGATGMHQLSRYYFQLGDLTRSRYWYTRSIELGVTVSLLRKTYFEEEFQEKAARFENFRQNLPDPVRNANVPIHVLYNRYAKRILKAEDGANTYRESENISDLDSHSHCSSGIFSSPSKFQQLSEYAASGRKYAQLIVEALDNYISGVESIMTLLGYYHEASELSTSEAQDCKKNALAKMASWYSSGVEQGVAAMTNDCKTKLMEIAVEFVKDGKGRDEDSDFYARVCRLHLLSASRSEALKFAQASKALYPRESYFYYMESNLLGLLGRNEEGLRVADEGLELFPGNWGLLFCRAAEQPQTPIPTGSSSAPKEDAINFVPQIQAYQDIIHNVPEDHRNIPHAWYSIACLHLAERKYEDAKQCYERGLKAEEQLLSIFLPYESESKKVVERKLQLISIQGKSISEFRKDAENVLGNLLEEDSEEAKENRQLQLTNPKRAIIVKECRRKFASYDPRKVQIQLFEMPGFPPKFKTMEEIRSNKYQTTPLPLGEMQPLKPILFEDMDPTIDKIYEGYFISLTIMEEYLEDHTSAVCTIVKDDNSDFQTIWFINFDRGDPMTRRKLGFGSRIQLLHPYLRLPQIGAPVIRVTDPNSVIPVLMGDENPICRYCWKPDPVPRCGRCKTSKYCDQECQRLDWELLEHKKLCDALRQRVKK